MGFKMHGARGLATKKLTTPSSRLRAQTPSWGDGPSVGGGGGKRGTSKGEGKTGIAGQKGVGPRGRKRGRAGEIRSHREGECRSGVKIFARGVFKSRRDGRAGK